MTISDLESALINVRSDKEYAQVYEKTAPNIVSDYLEGILSELNNAIDKIEPQDDTQKEFNAIAKEDEQIESITYTNKTDASKDVSCSTTVVSLENGSEVVIECIDEPEENLVFDALAGTIVYKEYGDRRYTANKYYNISGIKCNALNRIGYNLNKSKKSLTFNYTMVDQLNTDNVWSGYVSTVTCIKSYVDWFGKKYSYDHYQYLQSNGVYKYLWEATTPLLGIPLTFSSTEYLKAYVYALTWGPTTVKLSECFQ